MAKTPASLGISTAQLWDTSATRNAFDTLVQNKRLDDQAAAERERQDALLAKKEDAERRKYIRDELLGYTPDMSNIWESRDGQFLREKAASEMQELFSEPGFGEKLYNADPKAVNKWNMFKMDMAGNIKKSADDKVKAAPYVKLLDRYGRAVENNEEYDDPNYYTGDLSEMYAQYKTPMGDIHDLIEKTDAMGSWNSYILEQNRLFDQRDQSSSTHQNKTTGRTYSRSGGVRTEEEIDDMVKYHWQDQEANARRMYYDLGIDFNKWRNDDALTDEEQKAVDGFIEDRKREAQRDTKKVTSTGVIKTPEEDLTPEDNQFIMDYIAPTLKENYTIKTKPRSVSDIGINLKETAKVQDEETEKWETINVHGEYANYTPISIDTDPAKTRFGFNDLETALADNPNVGAAVAAKSPGGRVGFIIFDKDYSVDRFIGFEEQEALASLIVQSNTYKNRKKLAGVGATAPSAAADKAP